MEAWTHRVGEASCLIA
ncbi:Hypothetical protein PFCIRM119_06660 [Propionibacterium freudenreichii]|uniref:Uncharacterized protein n=2 Tax=Propionibacterium freudenreichii TaxID=1744 RepID=D7GG77_PROFC|nr:Hypothetical protein PFREUD_20450 [Propionibacterium freudenreichii subsp. shermanii CIRM-BIA1]CDP49709.1 Hypothetical protein PFCIRM129_01670 [Propionibacterium freudenreichii subsp. freudenreichii]CEG85780.1 Hypothetical protein PFCIRM118_03035 [Propionibacterium freudenreichii]CEG88258.1 Hypothetical protein PFCIRM119_06660 [Propionibacterium freudenreichii]CEG91968.1 Hypothetical protein PFCIRM121_02075 [Propionibacterium freudenreichii]